MKRKISVNWIEDMAFETEVNGHRIVIDADEDVGGKDLGPRPKPLMMLALAGCTGMDVVSILKKMRLELDKFELDVEADMSEEMPKKFTSMKLIYKFKGKNLPFEKLEKAVNLSQEKYCGVSANLRDALALDYEIVIED